MICFQTGKWDLDKVSVTDIIRCLAMTMEAVIESPEVQVNGVVVVEDHAGMSIRHVFSMGSSDAKSVTQLMQDAFPARLKGQIDECHMLHVGPCLVMLTICLSVYLSIYLSVCLSVCLSICVLVCLSIYLSIYLSVYLSICLSVYLSVCLSVCLNIRLCS